MALETGTYIDDLVASNPPQSDSLTQAAGHLRLIKSTILATFPNLTGEVTATQTELNGAGAAFTAGSFVPAGAILPYGGASAPTGYVFCYGQAISRDDFADLFTAISTNWGAGNGTTTFNVPDLRDRMLVGKGNMGGVDAAIIDSLLTSTTLGATYDGEGAIDTITLSLANLPAHSHDDGSFSVSGNTGSDGNHDHTVTNMAVTGTFSGQTSSAVCISLGDAGASGGATSFSRSPNFSTVNVTGAIAGVANGNTGDSGPHTHTINLNVSGTSGTAGSSSAFTVAILNPCAVVNYIIKT